MKHNYLYYLEGEKQYRRLYLLTYGSHHDVLTPEERDELDEWVLLRDENLNAFENLIELLSKFGEIN